MLNRTPVAADARPPLPEFTPVPVRFRYDGWTPDRQKAFIEALAETGSVSRAAARVNMSLEGCYVLRRHAGAESFRRAWEAALDFGVLRLRDIAFERAVEGELIPVFKGERLMGYRRKHNDRLLMFCLRHYGVDSSGKRTTINYFSTRAEAGATSGDGKGAAAAASATTVRTVLTDGRGRKGGDASAAIVDRFEGLALDDSARAEIEASLIACAERQRLADAAIADTPFTRKDAELADPGAPFIAWPEDALPHNADFVSAPGVDELVFTDPDDGAEGDNPWHLAGAPVPDMYLPYATPENSTITLEEMAARDAARDAARVPAEAVAEVAKRKRKANWKRGTKGAELAGEGGGAD